MGCKYCSDNTCDPIAEYGDVDIFIDASGNGSVFVGEDNRQSLIDFEIKFCPMCGKQLN
jgi:hypothetical protein